MSALMDSAISGTVEWIGVVKDRSKSLRSKSLNKVELTFEGLSGEGHGGAIRKSCARVEDLYELGTPIRNVRQITVLSIEELQQIANQTGLLGIDPCLLGANIVVRGIPHFTLIPPSSRLQFSSGATITIDMENLPCNLPAQEIEEVHPSHGKGFKATAKRQRGVTAWVEREGIVSLGDEVQLYIPTQPAWPEIQEISH